MSLSFRFRSDGGLTGGRCRPTLLGVGRDLDEKHVLAQAPAAVIAVDLDGLVTFWSPGATELYGWAPEEVLGRRFREVVLMGDPLAEEVLDLVRAGSDWDGEMAVQHRDGTSLLVRVRNAPLHDADGEVIGVVGASVGVTEDRRREAARAEDLRTAVHRLTRLQALTAELVGATQQSQVVASVLTAGREAVHAEAIALALVRGDEVEVRASDGFSAEFTEHFSVIPLDADTPLTLAVRTGSPVLFPDATAMQSAFPAMHLDLRFNARAALPIVVGGTVNGALTLGFAESRLFDTAELEVLSAVSRLAGQALDRVRLTDLQRQRSLDLQHALLPHTVPAVEGLDIGWRYLGGTDGVEVGGDWYDVLPLPDSSTLLVIGDVMGSGTSAAAVMGQLRAMVQAFTVAGLAPGRMLAELDRALVRLAPDHLTTVALVRLSATSLTYASAGHPPAVLNGALLDGEVGPALGARSLAVCEDYPSHTVPVAPGSVLVLYTDGLVETRDEALDARIELLRATAAGCGGLGADELCDVLLTTFGATAGRRDDTALLVVRLAP
ncbi:MAG: magnesium or manganese-dependent protein phosphatase [Frankiales bacterium]|nr:magnesium or manganese-dependent protein phosphatase [Frankiales bacterium]